MAERNSWEAKFIEEVCWSWLEKEVTDNCAEAISTCGDFRLLGCGRVGEKIFSAKGDFKNLAQLYIVTNLQRVTTNKVRNYGKKLHSNFSQ